MLFPDKKENNLADGVGRHSGREVGSKLSS